jgi:hypothetical protein
MTNEAEIHFTTEANAFFFSQFTLQTSFSLLTFKDNKNNFTNNFSFKLKLKKKKHKQIMFASQY